MNQAETASVAASTLFQSLPKTEIDFLLQNGRAVSIRNGETIFLQGDPAAFFYVVLSGWVKLFRVDEHGQEAVLSVFSRGQSFGEAVALNQGNYPVSAEAVADCRLFELPAGLFVRRMTEEPRLALAMVTSVLLHLRSLVDQVETLKARSGAQRVGAFLVELCGQNQGPCDLVLPYDKALIAGRLGIKPESLSRIFAKLQSHGVSIKRNKAHIADVAALRRFAESDRADSWAR